VDRKGEGSAHFVPGMQGKCPSGDRCEDPSPAVVAEAVGVPADLARADPPLSTLDSAILIAFCNLKHISFEPLVCSLMVTVFAMAPLC